MSHPVITWVNHASFVVAYEGVRLICDPWLEGTAFKNGWALVAPTAFTYGDFDAITHMWISHQHPDHFAPTNLRKIPADVRERITVFYQTTDDKLVVGWLRSAGFAHVVELPLGAWLEIAPGFSIQCNILGDDSWLAMRAGDDTLLNVNDCILKTREAIEPIARAVGNVDVLFTQFSYAQWTGNPPEIERRRAAAREKYDRIRLQNAILRPKIIVPFASFVYFCHEENFFLNDSMNHVEDVARFIESELGAQAVVLYPGDTWRAGDPIDWHNAAQRYAHDLRERLAAGPTHVRRILPVQNVVKYIELFMQRLRRKNRFARALITGGTSVFLTDVNQGFSISIDGIRPSPVTERDADIATSSENLLYAFRTPWGGDTLHVSGRFTSWKDAHDLRFFAFMRRLHYYNVTPVDAPWFATQVRRLARGAANRVRRRILHFSRS